MTVMRATVKTSAVRISTRPPSVVRVSLGIFRALSELLVSLQFNFNGGGIPIVTGQHIDVNDVPFPCRIVGLTATADAITQAQIDFSRSVYLDYPTFVPVVGLAPVILDNVSKASRSLSAGPILQPGDILRGRVATNTAAISMSLGLRIVRLSV